MSNRFRKSAGQQSGKQKSDRREKKLSQKKRSLPDRSKSVQSSTSGSREAARFNTEATDSSSESSDSDSNSNEKDRKRRKASPQDDFGLNDSDDAKAINLNDHEAYRLLNDSGKEALRTLVEAIQRSPVANISLEDKENLVKQAAKIIRDVQSGQKNKGDLYRRFVRELLGYEVSDHTQGPSGQFPQQKRHVDKSAGKLNRVDRKTTRYDNETRVLRWICSYAIASLKGAGRDVVEVQAAWTGNRLYIAANSNTNTTWLRDNVAQWFNGEVLEPIADKGGKIPRGTNKKGEPVSLSEALSGRLLRHTERLTNLSNQDEERYGAVLEALQLGNITYVEGGNVHAESKIIALLDSEINDNDNDVPESVWVAGIKRPCMAC